MNKETTFKQMREVGKEKVVSDIFNEGYNIGREERENELIVMMDKWIHDVEISAGHNHYDEGYIDALHNVREQIKESKE